MDDEDNFDDLGLEDQGVVFPSQVNIKGIIISVLVILSVFGLVEVAVVIRTPPDTGPRVKGSRIKLANITHGIFQPNSYNATWVSGSELLFVDDAGALLLLDINNSTSRVLVNANVFRHVNSHKYYVSPNLQYLLISHHEAQEVRGQSGSLAQYSVQKITSRFSSPLISLKVTKSSMWAPQEQLQVVEWVGDGVVMVKDNDIYHQPDLASPTIHRITNTGQQNAIYNGVTDWLYRERILKSVSALWVSPGGTWMAYASFNDSLVSQITFPELEPEDPAQEHLGVASVRYPKSGGSLPTVILRVYSFQDKHEKVISPPSRFTRRDYYVSSVRWVNKNALSISWLSRLHDIIIHTLCPAPDFNCKQSTSLTASLPDLGCSWLTPTYPIYSSSLQSLLLIKPVKTQSGFFPQVVLEDLSSSSPPLPLIEGNYTVFNIVAWDEQRSKVYFMGNLPDKPGQRHLLSASSLDSTRAPQCLTCSSSCQYSDIHMSPSASAYVQVCQGPDIPYTQLFSLPDNKLIWLLDNNRELRNTVAQFSMPQIKDLTVDLPWSHVPARIRLLLPPGFREYEEFAFPLLLNVDGSPGSQSVTQKWDVGWDTYLASNRDFIVAKIDVRGSSGQGIHFQNMKKRSLGQTEVQDILYILRYLSGALDYVDSSRVGVYGSDYGGFLAGMVLARDAKHSQSIINCAISISPVADWQQYDTFFTDRHMGLSRNQTSWNKYSQSSLVSQAKNIPPKKMYLVHRPDDLINLEQSMILSQSLIQSGVLFRQQIYLETYRGGFWQEHMYKSMEHYLEDLFGPLEDIFKDDYYVASLAELII